MPSSGHSVKPRILPNSPAAARNITCCVSLSWGHIKYSDPAVSAGPDCIGSPAARIGKLRDRRISPEYDLPSAEF